MADHMSGGEFEAVERKLAELCPNGDSLNHDQIMFLAGRESAPPPRRTPWIVATVGMSLISSTLTMVVVWQSQQASNHPMPSIANHGVEPSPPNESVAHTTDSTRDSDFNALAVASTFMNQERHYLKLRERVIAQGMDAWPTVLPANNHESPDAPSQLRSSIYQLLDSELQDLLFPSV